MQVWGFASLTGAITYIPRLFQLLSLFLASPILYSGVLLDSVLFLSFSAVKHPRFDLSGVMLMTKAIISPRFGVIGLVAQTVFLADMLSLFDDLARETEGFHFAYHNNPKSLGVLAATQLTLNWLFCPNVISPYCQGGFFNFSARVTVNHSALFFFLSSF
jgi:hypothetical protein